MPEPAPSRSLSRATAAVLLLYLLVRGAAHAPMLPAALAAWMPYIADALFLASLFLPALWGVRPAPSLAEAAEAAATAAKVGVFLVAFLAPSVAHADVVKSPGAPTPPAWGMLVVPVLMIGVVVLGAGAVKLLLWAAERRRRARCGPLALLFLAVSSPALASPASPSAGESIAIAGGCMAILFVVVGSVVAGCQLTMRRQRRRGGRLVGALLLLAAPAYADPPAAVESPAPPAPVVQPALAPPVPAINGPVVTQQPPVLPMLPPAALNPNIPICPDKPSAPTPPTTVNKIEKWLYAAGAVIALASVTAEKLDAIFTNRQSVTP